MNTGDGLAVLALGALRDNEVPLGRRLAAQIWSEFDLMARQTVDGQARELGWQLEGRTDLTPDDYLDMIIQKTCWYTTLLPLRVGALIGPGAADLEPMLRFGFFLGAAFQIRDDILNLIGSEAAYGKELLGDLREGKQTLMLIHLLAAPDPRDRERVAEFLALPPTERSAEVIADILAMMHSHGSVAFADEFARGIARSAAVAFEEAFADVPDSPARRFVRDLVSRTPASSSCSSAASVVVRATPAVRSSSTVVSKPSRRASSAVARTQWSVAIPTTSTRGDAALREPVREGRALAVVAVTLEPAVGSRVLALAEDGLDRVQGPERFGWKRPNLPSRPRSGPATSRRSPDPPRSGRPGRCASRPWRRCGHRRPRARSRASRWPAPQRAAVDGERPALAEVVLDVDDDERALLRAVRLGLELQLSAPRRWWG